MTTSRDWRRVKNQVRVTQHDASEFIIIIMRQFIRRRNVSIKSLAIGLLVQGRRAAAATTTTIARSLYGLNVGIMLVRLEWLLCLLVVKTSKVIVKETALAYHLSLIHI